MGEHADDAVDVALSEREMNCAHPRGMGAPVYQCRYCGVRGLAWQLVGQGWRLFDGGELHKCAVGRGEVDDGS